MPTSNPRRRWFVAFFATLACFIVANLVAVHLHSDAGLLEGLGLVDRWQDDIRRVGFPFQFFEEGGEVHRRIFSSLALLLDLASVCEKRRERSGGGRLEGQRSGRMLSGCREVY